MAPSNGYLYFIFSLVEANWFSHFMLFATCMLDFNQLSFP